MTDFHEKNYITAIQKLAFHFPHMRILGTHHCGKKLLEAFKRHKIYMMFYDVVIMQSG